MSRRKAAVVVAAACRTALPLSSLRRSCLVRPANPSPVIDRGGRSVRGGAGFALALQDEPAAAIGAVDLPFLRHVQIDQRVPERAAAAVATDHLGLDI